MDKKQAQAVQQASAEVEAYVKQLTPIEKKVLKIATEHLETSFSLENSIGFLKWKSEENKKLNEIK